MYKFKKDKQYKEKMVMVSLWECSNLYPWHGSRVGRRGFASMSNLLNWLESQGWKLAPKWTPMGMSSEWFGSTEINPARVKFTMRVTKPRYAMTVVIDR